MNKNFVFTIVAALTATVCANAQTARATFTTPFAFHTATVSMPAGEYQIEKVNWCVIRLSTSDGSRSVMLAGGAPTNPDADGVAKLVFNRYGAKYFLKEYRPAGTSGMELQKGRSEKEMVAAATRPETAILLASRTAK